MYNELNVSAKNKNLLEKHPAPLQTVHRARAKYHAKYSNKELIPNLKIVKFSCIYTVSDFYFPRYIIGHCNL